MSETDVAPAPVMDTALDPTVAPAQDGTEAADQPQRRKRRKPRDPEQAVADAAEFEAAAVAAMPAVEAILMSMERPLPGAQIAEALGIEDKSGVERVARAVELLNQGYDAGGRTFRIEKVAGGYRVMTRPDLAWAVAAIHGVRESHKLSRAAVETLAIVAYKQPITRAAIEAIRGVNAGEVLRTLLDRRLVDIVGRAEELGRPMLYGTSKRFLEVFGLASLKDLPAVGEFFPGAGGTPTAPTPVAAGEVADEAADEAAGS